ncbi:MAG TPA: hypothetical protein PK812_09600 [Beijerinckiaceae bacterium]|nr:hypothetical protein [Beijerinckiaceae bacterium]
MKTQDPINLTSFRSEATRQHSRALEQQYRIAIGLVAVLCAATVAAIITLAPMDRTHVGLDMTASGKTVSLGRS